MMLGRANNSLHNNVARHELRALIPQPPSVRTPHLCTAPAEFETNIQTKSQRLHTPKQDPIFDAMLNPKPPSASHQAPPRLVWCRIDRERNFLASRVLFKVFTQTRRFAPLDVELRRQVLPTRSVCEFPGCCGVLGRCCGAAGGLRSA